MGYKSTSRTEVCCKKNFLRNLNELEVMKQYQIKISYESAALENISASEDINRAWENIQENIRPQQKRD
jgi:hypothetical protein